MPAYREQSERAEPVETALPLPRRNLILWSAVFVFACAAAVALPGFVAFPMKDTGGADTFVRQVLQPILSMLLVSLGIGVIRGRRRIPPWSLLVIALVPFVLFFVAATRTKDQIRYVLEHPSSWPNADLESVTATLAQTDADMVLGGMASGFLCAAAAVAIIASLFTIDFRRTTPAVAKPPATETDAKLRRVNRGVAIGLAVVAIGLFLGLFGQRAVPHVLAIIIPSAAIFFAGDRLIELRTAENVEAEEFHYALKSWVTAAILIVLAVVFLDRAALQLIERNIFLTLLAHDDLSVLASQLKPASTCFTISIVMSVVLVTPMTIAAFRLFGARLKRLLLAPLILTTLAIALLLQLSLGWRETLAEVHPLAGSAQSLLPEMPVRMPASAKSMRPQEEVNVTIPEHGPGTTPRKATTGSLAIAPDSRAALDAIIFATRNADAGGWFKNPPLAPQTYPVTLVGVVETPALPAPLANDFGAFVTPQLRAYEIALSTTIAAQTTAIYIVQIASSDNVIGQFTCDDGKRIIQGEIPFGEPEAATRVVTDAVKRCKTGSGWEAPRTRLIVLPLENTYAKDLFLLLRALPANESLDHGWPHVEITTDRARVHGWLLDHAVGSSTVHYKGEGVRVVAPESANEVITKAIRAHGNAYFACYKKGLAKPPYDLNGRVSIKLTTDANGAVSGVDSSGSEITDEDVIGCLKERFLKMTFPLPQGANLSATYLLVMTPGM